MNGEAKEKAFKFISDEHTFYDGIAELKYYKEFMEMTYNIPKNAFFDRIRLNNEDVAIGLMEIGRSHLNILMNHLIHTYREHNLKYCSTFFLFWSGI